MIGDEPNTVAEPARQISVRGENDVVIAGGGLGGIAAGVASARSGAKTLLIERTFVGGVATAGMCCSTFNCYYTHDHELGSTEIEVETADSLPKLKAPEIPRCAGPN